MRTDIPVTPTMSAIASYAQHSKEKPHTRLEKPQKLRPRRITAAATVTPMITVETPATTATNVENRQVAAHTTVTVPPVPAAVTAPTMPSMATAPPVTAVAEAPNLRALTIGTANNGTGESFHLQAPTPTTGVTNVPARPGVTFGATPNISDINARMMEIANNGPPATTTTDRPDRQRTVELQQRFHGDKIMLRLW